jgi:DnaK suppressor protein
MTRAEQDMWRERLQEVLSRVDRERSGLKEEALQGAGGEAGGGLSNVPLHLADLAGREAEEEVTLTLLGNAEQILAEVNAALARIEQGTFGRCEACGCQIPRSRLLAVPYARHCVGCAQSIRPEVPA